MLKILIRIGEMKLMVGDAGRPDGWIPPADVLGLESDEDIEKVFKTFQPCALVRPC